MSLIRQEIRALQTQSKVTALVPTNRMICENVYYKQGLPGSKDTIYVRASVANRLQDILQELPDHLGIIIFDGFRSLETQKALFENFRKQVAREHPELSPTQVIAWTKNYVSHQDLLDAYKNRFVHPHNSGGAIDIAFFDLQTQSTLDYGCPFDDPNPISATDYFAKPFDPSDGLSKDAWEQAKLNRSQLFETMKKHGFANFTSEWWHYELGSKHWALACKSDWSYPSMEEDIF